MLFKVKGSGNFYTRFTAPNGERICRSTRTKNKKFAEEYEQQLREKLWRAYHLGHIRHTWEEAVVAYSLGKQLSQQQWHLLILDKYCRGKYLDEIDIRDQLVSDRLKEVSNSTINRTLEVFRSVMKTAERKGWCEVRNIEMLDEPKGVIRWITRDEAEKLLATLPDHLSEMARFSLATGLRESNVTGLEWSRVDLERRMAWIEANEHKNEEPHHVPLNAEAILVLRRQSGRHSRWVFTYKGRRVLKINNTGWRKALERAGIENFRVHDLRHTWASWHVQNGTPLPVLQRLGGWKTLAIVMRYAHLGQSHVSEHAENICRPRVVGKELAIDDLVSRVKAT
jgi:integrase